MLCGFEKRIFLMRLLKRAVVGRLLCATSNTSCGFMNIPIQRSMWYFDDPWNVVSQKQSTCQVVKMFCQLWYGSIKQRGDVTTYTLSFLSLVPTPGDFFHPQVKITKTFFYNSAKNENWSITAFNFQIIFTTETFRLRPMRIRRAFLCLSCVFTEWVHEIPL